VKRVSMAARISLLAACAVGISVAMASLAAYVTLRAQLHERLDDSLMNRAEAAAKSQIVAYATRHNLPATMLGAGDLRIYLIYANGAIVPDKSSSWVTAPSRDEIAVARGDLDHSLRTIDRDRFDVRAATVPAGNGTALMFVQSAEPIERTLDRMQLVLLLVGIGGIVSAGIIGLAVARSALLPVRRLSAAAEHIARTDELTPIAVTGHDELASLAKSFNEMLASLEASRDRQRRLVADAGHELRTPLTSLRTNLELLAQADRQGGLTSAQRDEIFTDATAQVEELSTLVGDLVELARDEPLVRTPEPLDLADIVSRAVDRVRRRAIGVTFDVDLASWWIVGEAQIIERAVTNLLDNAAKWSPPNGHVTVRLDAGVLTVADEGPGVAEADLPMIFERFYRAPDARTMPGSGLGLSIVRQAAQRHGGSVEVRNREPTGSVFTMSLPGDRSLATTHRHL
jgi:two-component system, OmpR family, sensor histidine kinase MprB